MIKIDRDHGSIYAHDLPLSCGADPLTAAEGLRWATEPAGTGHATDGVPGADGEWNLRGRPLPRMCGGKTGSTRSRESSSPVRAVDHKGVRCSPRSNTHWQRDCADDGRAQETLAPNQRVTASLQK